MSGWRLVLAVSLDGRLAPPQGGAAQLGGPADRRVLEEALAWSDAALVGAETLRLHGSTCLLRRPELLAMRRSQGREPQPLAIAVSRSGALPAALPFFSQPLRRWLLAPPPRGEADPPPPAGFERRLPLLDWPRSRALLEARGLGRIAVLGGARLAASLLEADLIDELQLTLCPRLLGGGHTWLPPTARPPQAEGPDWRLAEQRPLADGELLLRYRRVPS